jgi:hypothetical protein
LNFADASAIGRYRFTKAESKNIATHTIFFYKNAE